MSDIRIQSASTIIQCDMTIIVVKFIHKSMNLPFPSTTHNQQRVSMSISNSNGNGISSQHIYCWYWFLFVIMNVINNSISKIGGIGASVPKSCVVI